MSSSGKKKFGPPDTHASHPNVVPLIDIIMCMIVFFMLVAKIGVATGADDLIEIPISHLGKDLDLTNTLVLNVREVGGEPFVTGMIDQTSGKAVEIRVFDAATNTRPLTQVLRRFRYGADMQPGGAGENRDNPEFKVVIRGDSNMTYAALAPVLMACAEADVKNVNHNTAKPQ
jgi:biopolymer transport protein ExbD